jgi:glycosyltransferase involved in cell wall biosynthesis
LLSTAPFYRMIKPLRILLVLSESPLPFGHACGRWYYVLLKELVDRGHQVRTFVMCADSKEIRQARDLFPASKYDMLFYPRRIGKGFYAKWATFRRPYSYAISPDLRNDLRNSRESGFDVLHLEGIWSGWLGRSHDAAKAVLNFHSLYDIDQETQPICGWVDWFQKELRRRAEYHLLRSHPTLLTLTPRLRDGVQTIAPESSVHVVPLGIDVSLYDFIPKEQRIAEPVISVIGSMNWHPSRSAAVRLLTHLWPKIKERMPEAKLKIIGWDARASLREFLTLPDVEIIENVPDTRPYFEQTNLFLYTPGRGSGMKVKVLEAFAFGIPVVTTSEGVEGIPAEDGIHASLCDEDVGLIERTVRLLHDVDQQERQRLAARKLLESHCSPRATLDAVERVYTGIVERQS